jgi:hypothetical protein
MWGTEKQMKMVREVILETEKMPGVEKAYESPYPPPRMSRVLNAEAAVNELLTKRSDGAEFTSAIRKWKAELRVMDAEVRAQYGMGKAQ